MIVVVIIIIILIIITEQQNAVCLINLMHFKCNLVQFLISTSFFFFILCMRNKFIAYIEDRLNHLYSLLSMICSLHFAWVTYSGIRLTKCTLAYTCSALNIRNQTK